MSSERTQTLYCHYKDFSAFAVPEGIDLRDTKNVKWFVRWNTLHIELKNGDKYEIEATDSPQLKRPESCSLYDPKDNEEEDVDFNTAFETDSEESSSEDEEKSES